MLSQQDNELFAKVGPGTPMGEVLRRYWHPVSCSEFVTKKPHRVKVLGEELVLYRGEDGQPALMQLRCAHRSVALDRRGAPVLPLRTWNLLGEYFPYGAIGDALALVRMSRSSSGAAREK